MKVLALLIFAASTQAAAATYQFYLPNEDALAEARTVCGNVPSGNMRLPLADGLSLNVSMAPRDGKVTLVIQISLPRGARVRFSSAHMELQRNDASNSKVSFELGRFQVSVAGRRGQPGRYEFFAPDSDLEGLGRNAELAQPKTQYLERDLFFSRVIFDAEAADGFVVVFPAVGVNGKLLASRSVPVHLVERQGFPTCVQ